MACAASVSPKQVSARVRIFNPVPGGSISTSHERALRFVRNGRAHFNGNGQLVFHGRNVGMTRSHMPVQDHPSGADAFPDRAVFPPSPEVLARMGPPAGPV